MLVVHGMLIQTLGKHLIILITILHRVIPIGIRQTTTMLRPDYTHKMNPRQFLGLLIQENGFKFNFQRLFVYMRLV